MRFILTLALSLLLPSIGAAQGIAGTWRGTIILVEWLDSQGTTPEEAGADLTAKVAYRYTKTKRGQLGRNLISGGVDRWQRSGAATVAHQQTGPLPEDASCELTISERFTVVAPRIARLQAVAGLRGPARSRRSAAERSTSGSGCSGTWLQTRRKCGRDR